MKNPKTNEEAIFMSFQEENVIKLCGFYVSDWHLITMLLPYINKKIDEKVKIATILENDIEDRVSMFVKKLKIPNGEKILKINWKNKREITYNSIKRIIEKNLEENKVIIINGSKDFINKVNAFIKQYMKNNIEKIKNINANIKIVNCFNVVEFNTCINEILDNHDKILNTSGEREITDIFEDYKRKERIS